MGVQRLQKGFSRCILDHFLGGGSLALLMEPDGMPGSVSAAIVDALEVIRAEDRG